MSRRTARLGVLGALAGAAVLAAALPAAAHVTITTIGSATQGASDVVLDFKVPTESDTASTVTVDVQFDTPLAQASPQPVAGWTAKVVTAKLDPPITTDDGTISEGVGEIVWTATGTGASAGIPPNQFGQFFVEAGPLPTTPTVAFRTIQTYSDGSVVKWIEPTIAGQAEPEHPAPVLQLTAASASASAAPTAAASGSTGSGSSKDSTGRTLGIVGIVVGAVGLATAGVALTRKPSASS